MTKKVFVESKKLWNVILAKSQDFIMNGRDFVMNCPDERSRFYYERSRVEIFKMTDRDFIVNG